MAKSGSSHPFRTALILLALVAGVAYVYTTYGADGGTEQVAGLFGKKEASTKPTPKRAHTQERRDAEADAGPAALGLPNFVPIVEKVSPAVVNVYTTQTIEQRVDPFPFGNPEDFFRHFFGPPGGDEEEPRGRTRKFQRNSLGSGFIVDADGYVLTNYHVIDNADVIRVSVGEDRDATDYQAEVIGSDRVTDIALLKIEPDNGVPVVSLGDSDALRQGEWVLAIGNPLGLAHSVSAGIVSATGRRNIRGEAYDDFIQTDASINRGNSGGPLINTRGEVIGINTMIFSPTGGSIGIGFATPINMVKEYLPQLRDEGKVTRGWLGVRIQPVDDELAESYGLDEPYGALVVQVQPGGPAAEAGIRQEDIILGVEGERVADSEDLVRRVGRLPANKIATLTVWRAGEKIEIDVDMGERPAEPDDEDWSAGAPPSSGSDGGAIELETLGMTVEALPGRMKRGPLAGGGVLVTEVDPAGQAAGKGIRDGDVILSVNGARVDTIAAFSDHLPAFQSGKVVRLQLFRDGAHSFKAFRIK